jgi:chaperonin GroEL (HSP60 family)
MRLTIYCKQKSLSTKILLKNAMPCSISYCFAQIISTFKKNIMKSLMNNTVLAIMIATTIISCSKENVMQQQMPTEGLKNTYNASSSKSDTPYVAGIVLDTPYVGSSLHKGGDTPYLGNKLVDTPYLKSSTHRNLDTPYVGTKPLDTPYVRR